MTDRKAKQLVNGFSPVYSDEQVCTDPYVWMCELTVTVGSQTKKFSGTNDTCGLARIDARELAAAWIAKQIRNGIH